MLYAGKLRHKVKIQQPVYTQDQTTGEMLPVWAVVARTRADFVPLSGREFMAANEEQSKVTGRMTIRFREGIDASMRVILKGKAYNIEAVLPDKESGNEYLSLMVSEGVRPNDDSSGGGPEIVNVVDMQNNVVDSN